MIQLPEVDPKGPVQPTCFRAEEKKYCFCFVRRKGAFFLLFFLRNVLVVCGFVKFYFHFCSVFVWIVLLFVWIFLLDIFLLLFLFFSYCLFVCLLVCLFFSWLFIFSASIVTRKYPVKSSRKIFFHVFLVSCGFSFLVICLVVCVYFCLCVLSLFFLDFYIFIFTLPIRWEGQGWDR